MARRRKTSSAEDLIDLVAMLPWWGGVLLALLTYLLLHRLAVQPLMPSSADLPTQAIWKGLATVAQYVLPILCLAGAGMSAWRRSERTKLIVDVAQSQSISALDGMSWREFEMLVGEGFRLQGYQVVETGGGSTDGGIDLVLSQPSKNGNEKFLCSASNGAPTRWAWTWCARCTA